VLALSSLQNCYGVFLQTSYSKEKLVQQVQIAFSLRLADFHIRSNRICMFKTASPTTIGDVLAKMQMEINESQNHDSFIRCFCL
jgi:hypothetical protein